MDIKLVYCIFNLLSSSIQNALENKFDQFFKIQLLQFGHDRDSQFQDSFRRHTHIFFIIIYNFKLIWFCCYKMPTELLEISYQLLSPIGVSSPLGLFTIVIMSSEFESSKSATTVVLVCQNYIC